MSLSPCAPAIETTPGDNPCEGHKCNKWFGVNGSSSTTLSLLRINKRLFMTLTASAITVERTSLFTRCSFNNDFQNALYSLDHPFPCSSHMTCNRRVELSNDGLLSTEVVHLLLVPILEDVFQRLVCTNEIRPLSLQISLGYRRMLINLLKEFIIESTSHECAISVCTAHTLRHVNRQPNLFPRDLPCFTSIGPKQFTKTYMNGGSFCVTFSLGRSIMNRSAGFIFFLLAQLFKGWLTLTLS